MQWLYARYISKQTKRSSCLLRIDVNGRRKAVCLPILLSMPLSKAIGHWCMTCCDDKSIDINTQDKLGNTACTTQHRRQAMRAGDLYLYLVAQGADDSLHNRDGDSAARLRRQNTTAARTLAASIVAELTAREQPTTLLGCWLMWCVNTTTSALPNVPCRTAGHSWASAIGRK